MPASPRIAATRASAFSSSKPSRQRDGDMRAQSGRARAIFALAPDHRTGDDGTGDRSEEIGAEHVHGLTDPPHESGDEGDARRPCGVRGIACVIARALTAANTPRCRGPARRHVREISVCMTIQRKPRSPVASVDRNREMPSYGTASARARCGSFRLAWRRMDHADTASGDDMSRTCYRGSQQSWQTDQQDAGRVPQRPTAIGSRSRASASIIGIPRLTRPQAPIERQPIDMIPVLSQAYYNSHKLGGSMPVSPDSEIREDQRDPHNAAPRGKPPRCGPAEKSIDACPAEFPVAKDMTVSSDFVAPATG